MIGALLCVAALTAPSWDGVRTLPLLSFDDGDRYFVDGTLDDGTLAVDGEATVRLGGLWPRGGWSVVLLDVDGAATFELVSGGLVLARGRSAGTCRVALPLVGEVEPTAVRVVGEARVRTLSLARTDTAWPVERWRVRRDGLTVHADGAAVSWSVAGMPKVREVNETRAVLGGHSVYRDGRVIVGGRVVRGHAAGHEAPARLTVDGGRVERAADGDADGDGYDERLGSYRVRATGRRLTVRLVPDAGPVRRPVIEVAGLPAGEVLATVGGALAESAERLGDGRVLVTLAQTVASPVEVRVSVTPPADRVPADVARG